MQWNADHTEHVHITEIKNAGRRGNNQNYEPQIARNLDCSDKCHCFDLATSLKDVGFLFGQDFGTNYIDTTAYLLEEINPVFDLEGNRQKPQLYFALAPQLQNSLFTKVSQPFCTFTSYCHSATYHLSGDLNITRASIDQVATTCDLSDLYWQNMLYILRSIPTVVALLSTTLVGGVRRVATLTSLSNHCMSGITCAFSPNPFIDLTISCLETLSMLHHNLGTGNIDILTLSQLTRIQAKSGHNLVSIVCIWMEILKV